MNRGFGLLAAACLWPGTGIAADETRLSIGLYHGKGDYGTATTTEIDSVSLGVRHRAGPWTLRATLPWLKISGASNVLPDGTVVAGLPVRRVREGLGDLVLSVSRRLFYDAGRRYGAGLRFKVKLPTASRSEGLGTGEPDYTIEWTPFGRWGRTTLFGAIGYRFYGDTDTTDYRDVWLARAGFSVPFREGQRLGLSASHRQANRAGREDRRSAMAFHVLEAGDWRVQTYLIKGLSDATTDLAGGLSVSHRF